MGMQDKGKEKGSQKKAPKRSLMEKRKLKQEKKKNKQFQGEPTLMQTEDGRYNRVYKSVNRKRKKS